MADLVLTPTWGPVRQIDRNTRVDGGVAGDGPSNYQGKDNGNRTQYLKEVLLPLAEVANLEPESPDFSLFAGWTPEAYADYPLKGPGDSTPIWLLLKPRHGSTLVGVEVSVNPVTHSGIPATMPGLRVQRIAFTGANQDLSSLGVQRHPTPALVADWTSGGDPKTMTYTCNQNNVIDRTTYRYRLVLEDESDTNAVPNNRYYAARLIYADIE